MTHQVPSFVLIVVLFLACSDDNGTQEEEVPTCGPYPDQEFSNYILPYEVGTTFLVSQGNCSPPGRSHLRGTSEQYSYDFEMPIGTPIVASNTGTVTRIVENFEENNGTPGQENRIEITHGDGTVTVYIHLTKDGADVSVGQKVLKGKVIGRSGNTGNSTGPHLHFCRWRKNNSMPMVFSNARPHPNGLIELERYEALPF